MDAAERLKRKNEFDGNLVIGVRQFNLATGRDRHLKQRAQKQTQYIDPATGLLRKELTMLRSCPVCGTNEHRILFVKEGFRYLKCGLCGMVYVNPVLKKELVQCFYQDEDSYTQVLLSEIQLSLDRKKFQYGLDIIEEYLPQKGKLLDVGCGPGLFLQVSRERGWQVQGVEFNKRYIQQLKEKKIEIVDVPIEQANFPPDTFQCVSLWTVLEHSVNPKDFLRIIYKILTPGGIMLILVPNIDSLALRILHEKSATFFGDSHINFFNVSTLSRLLKEEGFKLKECESVLTEIGTINNFLSFEDPYFGEGNSVLNFLTPNYIHDNMLGYCLLALAEVSK